MTKENGGDDYIYDVMTAKKENQGCGKIIGESSLSKGYICGDKYLCYNCQKKKENHSQQAKNDKLSQGGNHGDTPSVDNTHKTHIEELKEKSLNDEGYEEKLCYRAKLQEAELYEKKIDWAFGKLKTHFTPVNNVWMEEEMFSPKEVCEFINKIREEMK